MKISKQSWHYRYITWLEFPAPNNLCTYFWVVVFIVVTTPIVLPLFLSITGYFNYTETREPGLLRSWWRAKKEKVCPLIEFTE